MSGGVKNIYVEDCTFMGTDVGLRFKSTRGRGGVVENIYINNINMINIPNEPLLFDLFYGGKGAGEESEEDLLNRMKTSIPPVTEETPAFRNIHISNIARRGPGRAPPGGAPPGAAGAAALRTNTAVHLQEQPPPTVIRGNISDIKTLALGSGKTRGVDADVSDAESDENLESDVALV